MRRIIAFILLLAIVPSLSSCQRKCDALSLMQELITAYGAEGTVYSPAISEGEDGYVREGFLEKIYIFSGCFPEDYAIFLNSRPDYSSECGVFFCKNAEMLGMVEEMCIERVNLLCRGDPRGFVKRSGKMLFYSTLQDRERTEKIFNEIIR